MWFTKFLNRLKSDHFEYKYFNKFCNTLATRKCKINTYLFKNLTPRSLDLLVFNCFNFKCLGHIHRNRSFQHYIIRGFLKLKEEKKQPLNFFIQFIPNSIFILGLSSSYCGPHCYIKDKHWQDEESLWCR